MCRIWGVMYGPGGAEAEPWTPTELAQIMFPALVRRGPDAWGWMSWDGKEHLDIYKFPGRCDTADALESMTLDDDPKWIVGHTRKATHGDPKLNRNNHPLHHGNVVGVHNGVLRNHAEILAVTGRQDPLTEVDSEAIFSAVNKWGPLRGLRRIRGDMVTVFVDIRDPRTLFIAKSAGRPLVLASTTTGAIYFASEEQALNSLGIDFEAISPISPNRMLTLQGGLVTSRRQILRPKVPAPSEHVAISAPPPPVIEGDPRGLSGYFAAIEAAERVQARRRQMRLEGVESDHE
jgi:glucosamine 6-phosphate synthetase-like amidotransferase/phosphosugar isomerase protein